MAYLLMNIKLIYIKHTLNTLFKHNDKIEQEIEFVVYMNIICIIYKYITYSLFVYIYIPYIYKYIAYSLFVYK